LSVLSANSHLQSISFSARAESIWCGGSRREKCFRHPVAGPALQTRHAGYNGQSKRHLYKR
jgi:hypothetical protein